MTIQATESQIQHAVIGYLRMRGYYVQRLNAGNYSLGKAGYVKGVAAGTPDVMAFKKRCIHHNEDHADILFVEVKRPGKKPTPLQKAKMEEMEDFGARCMVATSIDDLREAGI